AMRVAVIEADLAAQNAIVLDRIANDLKDAINSTVQIKDGPGGPNSRIEFQKCLGYTNGFVLSELITYYEEPGERIMNGVGELEPFGLLRRIEGTETSDITDKLRGGFSTPALQFSRDPLSPTNDVFIISVTLSRGAFFVTRTTKVQLRF
ncbi:MAG TPA: hypothetical protein VEJ63_04390, partial [Planctomycetota bacterium]|nr:hypothetical protein [Planctomycetota bacterium]